MEHEYPIKGTAVRELFQASLDGGIMNIGNGGFGVAAAYGMQQNPALDRNGPALKGPTPSI